MDLKKIIEHKYLNLVASNLIPAIPVLSSKPNKVKSCNARYLSTKFYHVEMERMRHTNVVKG